MRIIEREHIDIDRWNSLVKSQEGNSFFSLSWYMDAVAKNWCIVTDDYTSGMVLPYTDRLGVEALYTPIFVRYVNWFGEVITQKEALELIHSRFGSWDIQLASSIRIGEHCEGFIYQSIELGQERVLGSQAKRMLKKADRNQLEVKETSDFNFAFNLVSSELTGKHEGLTVESMSSLEKLLMSSKEESCLKVYYTNDQAAVICLEDENQVLYLKGTATKEMKELGAYYKLMDFIIEKAINSNKRFDFGGSRAEGVRRFNLNLGGIDQSYFHCTNDELPLWYKLAKGIKRKWKK